jgi:hypothetical protein
VAPGETPQLAPMAARYRRPDWVRRLIAMGDSLGGRVDGARRLVPLDPDELLDAAGAGPFRSLGDPQGESRFRELVRALDAAPMHGVGRLMTRQELLRGLRTRQRLARRWQARPEIGQERIEAPLVVTGPARSGTTILFELLGLDPALRAPLAWEALHPADPPETPAELRAMAECEQELWADVQPEFAAIHELRSDLPVECVTLTLPSFCGPHWVMVAGVGVPVDPVENYAFEKRILQVMQHGAAARTWLLKTPGHVLSIDLLFATFPDARVVQTHRDPAKTIPSTVSTTAMAQWLRSDAVDLPLLATAVSEAFAQGLNSVAERRAAGELPGRFVDVHFDALLRDPVETLRRAYGNMQRELGPDHAEAIRRYLAEKPRGKFGVHKYTPEEWGFTAAGLRERFVPYLSHFEVTRED